MIHLRVSLVSKLQVTCATRKVFAQLRNMQLLVLKSVIVEDSIHT